MATTMIGSSGTRTHDGFVFRKSRLPGDHDIIKIIRKDGEKEMNNKQDLQRVLKCLKENSDDLLDSGIGTIGSLYRRTNECIEFLENYIQYIESPDLDSPTKENSVK